MVTERTMLQQIPIDLKKHLLDLEAHVSLLKKRIFDLEKQIEGVELDEDPETDPAARTTARHSSHDDLRPPFRFLNQMG